MRSMFIRPVMLALVVASVGAAAYLGTAPTRVLAAETHTNCATFDNSGNILSLTPNCSETVHSPSPPNSFAGVNPCTTPPEPGTIVLNDDHSVFHINVNGAGDAWLTGTDGGRASFAALNPSAASGSGTWTSWFGGQLNNKSMVFGSTMHVGIRLSDGTTVTIHDTFHAMMTATGVMRSFDKPTLTCGG
jgi:hypothetical protein